MAVGRFRQRRGFAEMAPAWRGLEASHARTWSPSEASRQVLSPGQALRLRQGLALLAPAALFQPVLVLGIILILVSLLLSINLAWRATLIVRGIGLRGAGGADDSSPDLGPHGPRSLNPRSDLPTYTLLVALYREGPVLPGLAAALNALNWPPDRLEVLLCVEADDPETRIGITQCVWPVGTRCVVAPPGLPRTKPRALNLALREAGGDLIGLFDAEDRPHPDQLRAAHAAFQRGGPGLACVQAPLQAGNVGASWLAAQWAADYSVLFGLMVPAQARAELPVLLGGTSNHFRRTVLEAVGGWDPWNVTEDADLGVRLARAGYRTGVITPATLEEAPTTLRTWLPQRARWLKGFLQTWLVLMRAPQADFRGLGGPGLVTVYVGLLGSVLTALCHAPLTLWWALSLVLTEPDLGTGFGGLCLAIGLLVNGAGILAAASGSVLQRLMLVMTLPAYWAFQTVAAARALYGLVTAPHFWAKTPHYGLPGDLEGIGPSERERETVCISASPSSFWQPVSGLPSTRMVKRQNPSMRADRDGSRGER